MSLFRQTLDRLFSTPRSAKCGADTPVRFAEVKQPRQADRSIRSTLVKACLLTAIFSVSILAPVACAFAQATPASNAPAAQVSKAVGVLKTVQADSITLASESGGDVTAKLTATTKILRVPPGEKDLKNATPLQPQDLQPGDRVLVRGQAAADDAHTLTALAVIVMKQADVTAQQQQERDDWQKRGIGGLVTKVDAATNTITVSTGGVGTTKSVAVQVGNNTILRRYAPDSVKFDDAKPEPATQFMAQLKVGDQLRARGTRSADGGDLAAEEIVSGSFRNIAGTIKSIDPATNSMTVQDAISKSAIVVKVSPDSQMKKLPPEMAQRIAMRLKASGGAGGEGGGQSGAGGPAASNAVGARPSTTATSGSTPESRASRASSGGAGGGPGGSGPPDLQRMLSRLPNSKLSDLQKGDAVMIVSTEGGNSDAVTAITLLAGVDAILTAAPNRSASSLLSPWSLGAPGGEGETAQ
jgi:co-chaperonin GroES (HSP10)